MKILAGGFCALLIATVICGQTLTAAASCESLSSLTLSETTITLAQVVPAGGFSRPTTGSSAAEQGFSNPIAFCRVAATLKRSPDSDIKIEVWMPASGWNGKFQAVGNGGWAGLINDPAFTVTVRVTPIGTDAQVAADRDSWKRSGSPTISTAS